LNALEHGMAGFPDGYRSPYERETGAVWGFLALVCIGQAIYFFVIVFRARRMTFRSVGLGILAAIGVIVVPMLLIPGCPHIGACKHVYETVLHKGMDTGQGG
jgi:hypothetical protein